MSHAEQLAQTQAMLVRMEDLKTAHLELRIQHLDRVIERELENLAQDEDTTWRHTRQIMADRNQGNPATQDTLTKLDEIYSICLTFFAVHFQLSAQTACLSHWLHLFEFSLLCVFKCLLKSLACKDAK